MDIKVKPTLAEKQVFWAEQLPNFESKYWLQSHFEFVVFDMNQGNYVIKDGLDSDLEDDATEIWHRVNTGWAMWKKAINFTKAQAVPEGFILVKASDHDCEICDLIDDRDHSQEQAEQLKDKLQYLYGTDFGEHSNCNCPFQNAIDYDDSDLVLVKKYRLLEAVEKIELMFEEDSTLALGELLPIQQGIKAMIEAQEQSHEHS